MLFMHAPLRFMCLILFALGLVAPVRAGSFLQPPGEGLIISGAAFSGSVQAFDARGRILPVWPVRQFELGALVEYGFDEDTTLLFAPGARRTLFPTALGPLVFDAAFMDVGVRRRLIDIDDIVTSIQVTASAPVAGLPFVLRSDAARAEVRLGAGLPFEVLGMTGFYDTSVAYVPRFGFAPDELRFDMTFGYRPYSDVLVLSQAFNTVLLGGRQSGALPRMHKLQASVVVDVLPGLSVQLGLYHVAAGALTRRQVGVMSAVWTRF